MIDHVTIRLPDLVAGRAFYTRTLELVGGPTPTGDDRYTKWNDFSIAEATPDRPSTRHLQIIFRANDCKRWWQGMRDAGYAESGATFRRPPCSTTCDGAFVADPAGNKIETVRRGDLRSDGTIIDHMLLSTRNLEPISVFYEAVATIVGFEVERLADRTRIHGRGAVSFSFVIGEPTENVHIAFVAPDRMIVDAFHAAGTQAGYASLGEPGERPEYHLGYYGAFLADPDGHNIEAVHKADVYQTQMSDR